MTIARGPDYIGQHVVQYEYKCLLMDISDRSENNFTMFFDPQNIGLKFCFVQLSLILVELWRKIDFSLIAAIFCTIACVRHIILIT